MRGRAITYRFANTPVTNWYAIINTRPVSNEIHLIWWFSNVFPQVFPWFSYDNNDFPVIFIFQLIFYHFYLIPIDLPLSLAKLSITTFITYLSQNSWSLSLTKLLFVMPLDSLDHDPSQNSQSWPSTKLPINFFEIEQIFDSHTPIQDS